MSVTIRRPLIVGRPDAQKKVSAAGQTAEFTRSLLVVMVSVALIHRNNATVGDFAFHMLELDCRVHDAEVVMQNLFHVAENALADRGRDVGDRDMAGERPALRSDAPDV